MRALRAAGVYLRARLLAVQVEATLARHRSEHHVIVPLFAGRPVFDVVVARPSPLRPSLTPTVSVRPRAGSALELAPRPTQAMALREAAGWLLSEGFHVVGRPPSRTGRPDEIAVTRMTAVAGRRCWVGRRYVITTTSQPPRAPLFDSGHLALGRFRRVGPAGSLSSKSGWWALVIRRPRLTDLTRTGDAPRSTALVIGRTDAEPPPWWAQAQDITPTPTPPARPSSAVRLLPAVRVIPPTATDEEG